MNYLDIIIAIIFIISVIKGYKKGFIHQLTSLTAYILGIYLAIKASVFIAPLIQDYFSVSENPSKIIAFIAIFILVIIGVYLIGRSLEKFFEEVELSHFNKILGIVFSFVKTAIILSILFVMLNIVNDKIGWPTKQNVNNSFLYKPIQSIAPTIFPYLWFNKEKE